MSWTDIISGLEGKFVSTQTSRRLITSSHSEPLLRRLIITLWRSRLYTYVVDIRKAFDIVPREALFQSLRDIGIYETLLVVIMRLYDSVSSRLRMAHGLSDFIQSTIGVKQGCPLSPTLLGIYIDDLESYLHEHNIQEEDGLHSRGPIETDRCTG
jgi:hypothetical protein